MPDLLAIFQHIHIPRIKYSGIYGSMRAVRSLSAPVWRWPVCLQTALLLDGLQCGTTGLWATLGL